MHNKFGQNLKSTLQDFKNMKCLGQTEDTDGRIVIAIAHLLAFNSGELNATVFNNRFNIDENIYTN